MCKFLLSMHYLCCDRLCSFLGHFFVSDSSRYWLEDVVSCLDAVVEDGVLLPALCYWK